MSKEPHVLSGGKLLLLAMTCSSALLMEQLDSTILISAIPAIAGEFGIAPLRVNLAVTLYLVTVAAMIPASAWVADRFGAKRTFLTAICGFMLSSLGAACAQDLTMLIAMRVLQATFGAMMTPVSRLLLIRGIPREELATAIAWMSMPVLIGPVLGPLVGGWIVTYCDWRWIFLVNLPVGVLGLFFGWRFLPADGAARTPHPFDGRGFLLCAFVLAGAQLVLDQLVHPLLPPAVSLTLLAMVPAASLIYVLHARRHATPALDLTLLKLRLFRSAFLTGGLSRLGLNAVPFLLQIQLQLGFGWSAARAGMKVFAIAAGALVLKPLMRRVLAAFGFRQTLAWNAVLGALFTLALARVGPDTAPSLILVLVLLYGLTRSLQFNAINTLLYTEVPRARQSASTALGGVGQQLSMALGISLGAVMVAQLQSAGVTPDHRSISIALGVAGGVAALSGFVFLLTLQDQDGTVASGHGRRTRKEP